MLSVIKQARSYRTFSQYPQTSAFTPTRLYNMYSTDIQLQTQTHTQNSGEWDLFGFPCNHMHTCSIKTSIHRDTNNRQAHLYVLHVLYWYSNSIHSLPKSHASLHLPILTTTFPSENMKENDLCLWAPCLWGTHTHTHPFRVNMQLNLREALESYEDARHGRRHGRQDKSVNPNLDWTACWLTCCCRLLLHVTTGQILTAAVIHSSRYCWYTSVRPVFGQSNTRRRR